MRFDLRAYLKFLRQAKNEHGVHSPFVFDFVCQCLYQRKNQIFRKELKLVFEEKLKNKTSDLNLKRWLLIHRIITYFKIENFVELTCSEGILVKNLDIYPKLQKTFWSFSTVKTTDFISMDIDNYQEKIDHQGSSLYFVNRDFLSHDLGKILIELIEKSAKNSLLILDGIHLNQKNESVWKKLLDHPKIKVSVDLFFWGIIFFKQDQVEEHFKIRF